MIHLENVEKVYRTANGPVRALAGVSLEVQPGEFVVVRGPSGCGKSTLLNVVGGLASATAGRVQVAGEDLGAMSAAGRAAFRSRRLGFVFQTFHLLPYLTVVENVALAAGPGSEAEVGRRAEELLIEFNLGHRLRHRPAELSAGESQRAAIARALLNRPSLILADEPTGNLDPENAAIVFNLLGDFNRQGGTVLLVTHQQVEAIPHCRQVSMRNGSIEGDALAGSNLANGASLR
jgi:putative ABC transport system ATP-binding protein